MQTLTIEALSVAALTRALDALPHEARAVIIATERGEEWARLDIAPMTDNARAAFPLYSDGMRGDAERRQAHMGAAIHGDKMKREHALSVVANRARRMSREAVTA